MVKRLFSKLHHNSSGAPCFTFSFTHSLPVLQDVAADQPKSKTSAINLQSMTDQLLLEHYTPSAVLTTDKGDIIYISGHTGKYLEPAAGKGQLEYFCHGSRRASI